MRRYVFILLTASTLSGCVVPEGRRFESQQMSGQSIEAEQWSAGDVVAPYSGGLVMTVTHWSPETCRTMWFDDENQLLSEDFATASLIRVTLAEGQSAGQFDSAKSDKVRLASGGLHMTVTHWGSKSVEVQWLRGQSLNRAELPIGALVQVVESDAHP